MFDLCDKDASGYITKQELATICRQVSDEEVAASVLDNVMLCLDGNHDGHISFEEFKAGFQVREKCYIHSCVVMATYAFIGSGIPKSPTR